MGPARRQVGYVAWGDSLRRCILIRGRGVTSVRASARTNFYPCKVWLTLHHMLNARKAPGQTPVTGAPHL